MTEAQTAATADPVRIEVSTRALFDLLGKLKPFAGRDDTLPMLMSVVFEFEGDYLVASATDRYVLAVARLNVGERIARPGQMIGVQDIDALEKAFKPARGQVDSGERLSLTFGDESLAVETTATLDGQPTKRLALPWREFKPVAFRALISTEMPPGETTMFDPKYLARFTSVAGGDLVRIWPGSGNKPWRVTVNDDFFGLIMPCRPRDSEMPASWVPGPVNVAPEPKASRRSKRAAA